jgi:hypothetical protein
MYLQQLTGDESLYDYYLKILLELQSEFIAE